MNAAELLFKALPGTDAPEQPYEGICCVTGAIGPTVSRKLAISRSFTNLDLLRAPESDRIGLPAWRAITYTVPNGRRRGLAPLRQSHWFCDGESIQFLDRVGVRELVLVEDDRLRPWSGYATTSYKKHGFLRCPVNTGTRRVWLWETRLVDCSDMEAVSETWHRLRSAQDAGITRSMIENLDISATCMAKIGWRVWREFYGWAHSRRNAPLYQFLTFLLPSKEELKCATSGT